MGFHKENNAERRIQPEFMISGFSEANYVAFLDSGNNKVTAIWA